MSDFYHDMHNVQISEVDRLAIVRYLQQNGTLASHKKPQKPQRRKEDKSLQQERFGDQHVKINETPVIMEAQHPVLPFSALQVLADSSAVEDECVDLQDSSKFVKFHVQRLQRKLAQKRSDINRLREQNQQMREALKSAVLQLRAKRQSETAISPVAQAVDQSTDSQRNPKFDLLENAEIRKLQRRNSELTNKLEKLESSAAMSAMSTVSTVDNDLRQIAFLKQSKQKLKEENDSLRNQNAQLLRRVSELQESLAKSRANEEELGKVVIELSKVAQE